MLTTSQEKHSRTIDSSLIERLSHSSWVEINIKALQHNFASYKKIAPLSLLAPVIKSNAYGHGIDIVARACQESGVVDLICVVSVTEALRLRFLGITKPLVVLSILDNDLEQAIQNEIQLTVYDVAAAIQLNALGRALNKRVLIHIKVDTGLSRLGFLWDTAFSKIQELHTLSHLEIRGIFSHLADSESSDTTFTQLQISRFQLVLDQCERAGIYIPLIHTSCSAAITAHAASHFTMIRLGIGAYGLWPSQATKLVTQKKYPSFSLQSVLTWKTKIVQLKHVPSESYVGYERTHQVARETLVATLPVGYWDGYDRGLSNKSSVLVRNQLAPVIGRVAMNLMMVDVTGLDVKLGDEVTLLGDYKGVQAEILAHHAHTINYEVVTRINPLLPRVAV